MSDEKNIGTQSLYKKLLTEHLKGNWVIAFITHRKHFTAE